MSAYTQDLTVNWGESDPFGLVYYAREVAWFNEIEHELFRHAPAKRLGNGVDAPVLRHFGAIVFGQEVGDAAGASARRAVIRRHPELVDVACVERLKREVELRLRRSVADARRAVAATSSSIGACCSRAISDARASLRSAWASLVIPCRMRLFPWRTRVSTWQSRSPVSRVRLIADSKHRSACLRSERVADGAADGSRAAPGSSHAIAESKILRWRS